MIAIYFKIAKRKQYNKTLNYTECKLDRIYQNKMNFWTTSYISLFCFNLKSCMVLNTTPLSEEPIPV